MVRKQHITFEEVHELSKHVIDEADEEAYINLVDKYYEEMGWG